MAYHVVQSPFTAHRSSWIYEEFSHYAIHTVGFDGRADPPVAFEAYAQEECVGICVCELFWGNLHIKYLLTKSGYRGRGIATALMERALAFGKSHGCHFVFVETMSFQAPEFYLKLGFQIELKREGYAKGISFYYLKRDL